MCTLTRNSTPEECQAYFEKVEVERGMKPFPYNIEEVYQLKYSSKAHAVRAVKRDYPNDWEEHRNGRKIEVWISHLCFDKLFAKCWNYPVTYTPEEFIEKFYPSTEPKECHLEEVAFYPPTGGTPVNPNEVGSMETFNLPTDDDHITSIEIAQIVKKSHKHVLEDIRSMEQAWQEVCGSSFRLTSGEVAMPNGGTRQIPCYILDKKECLFVASKYNDVTRARIFKRWEEVEKKLAQQQAPLTPTQALLQSVQLLADLEQRQLANEQRVNVLEDRVNAMVENEKNRQLEIFEVETSNNPIPEITLRTKVKNLGVMYCEYYYKNTYGKDCYRMGWRDIYAKFEYRYHRRPQETGGLSKLDWVERNGLLPQLYDLLSYYINQIKDKL